MMLPKSLMLLGAATTGIGVLVITKLVLSHNDKSLDITEFTEFHSSARSI